MKKLLMLLIAGGMAIATSSWTCNSSNTFRTETAQDNSVLILSKNFNANSIKNVEVSTSGGSITVAGDAANNKATVEVFGQGNNGQRLSKEEIMQVLNRDYEFSVTTSNGTLKAVAKRKVRGSWKKAVNISFKIHTTKNVNTQLHTSGGSIKLASLQGEQQFSTSGGSIYFDNLSGTVDGHTSGGSISAFNSKGNIKASTSGGALNLKNLDGDIQMHTSGGSIRANNINGRLALSTSGGSINASFEAFNKDASLSTSGGSIRIAIPNEANMKFELSGSSVNVGAASHIQVQMNKAKDHATGSLNNGGAKLNAKTSGGSVTLNFK